MANTSTIAWIRVYLSENTLSAETYIHVYDREGFKKAHRGLYLAKKKSPNKIFSHVSFWTFVNIGSPISNTEPVIHHTTLTPKLKGGSYLGNAQNYLTLVTVLKLWLNSRPKQFLQKHIQHHHLLVFWLWSIELHLSVCHNRKEIYFLSWDSIFPRSDSSLDWNRNILRQFDAFVTQVTGTDIILLLPTSTLMRPQI